MTMRTLKHLVILSLIAFVAVFVAAPSALAKKALSEDEMDLITAAGQPKIIQTGTGSITFTDEPVSTLTLGTESQTSLTALVLNNVAGEAQLANALNVASVSFVNDSTQANTITQSWGATKDWTASTTAATATSSPGGTGGPGGDSTTTCNKCGVVRGAAGGAGGAGGAASAASADATNKILTKYADQIIETVSGDIFVHQDGTATLELDGTAQNSLAALVVNNVVGLTQVANAVNILSGNLGFAPLNVSAVGQQFGAPTQTNTINQFRGSPYGFADRKATQ
jgi:hypothetical protein